MGFYPVSSPVVNDCCCNIFVTNLIKLKIRLNDWVQSSLVWASSRLVREVFTANSARLLASGVHLQIERLHKWSMTILKKRKNEKLS